MESFCLSMNWFLFLFTILVSMIPWLWKHFAFSVQSGLFPSHGSIRQSGPVLQGQHCYPQKCRLWPPLVARAQVSWLGITRKWDWPELVLKENRCYVSVIFRRKVTCQWIRAGIVIGASEQVRQQLYHSETLRHALLETGHPGKQAHSK